MKTTVNVSDTVKNRKSTKTSKKASTAEAMLKAALDAAQVEYPPLSQLVKSPKNVRTLPYRGGKREPQKIPPFRIVEFFGGVVRGMTTRQRLPHLSEALWRDAETPGNSATPVPGPQ